MFDSHCHLNDSEFTGKVGEIYESSKVAGVKYIVVPAMDLETSLESIRLSEMFSRLYACVGIHPTGDLSEQVEDVIVKLDELVANNKIVAIGETGLDYYRYKHSPQIQRKYFVEHMKLAQKYGLPVIVHCRHAEDDMLEILSSHKYDGNIILHCCPSDLRLLEYARQSNSYIGVCGDVTYDDTKADFIREVPLNNLLVETDSPYQTPKPIRNTTKFPNYPSNLTYIIDEVANIKELKDQEVVEATTRNARKVFGI